MLKNVAHIFTIVFWKVNKMLDWRTQWQISVRSLWFWTAVNSYGEAEKTTFILHRSEEYYVSNCKGVLHRTANTRTRGDEHLNSVIQAAKSKIHKHCLPVTLISTHTHPLFSFLSLFLFLLQFVFVKTLKFTLGRTRPVVLLFNRKILQFSIEHNLCSWSGALATCFGLTDLINWLIN